ncbi:MAG: sulfite exporter TauE/SafE family protein, partial [Desulfovibrionaceae bacterium]|nr:sulfite exporter TauE/SafE family protein [Desulfovibrionaceae bacterium]
IPFAVAICVSFFTSMGGVSGAFLLLPFQMSVLGYTNPSVSATNQFYNIIACPSGVIRYWREGRLIAPIAYTIALGTLPGVFLGALIRIKFLYNPMYFKVFAGCVLLYISLRMVGQMWKAKKSPTPKSIVDKTLQITSNTFSKISFTFDQVEYIVTKKNLMILSLVVGLIGGIYGIGGGAIMSPFLVSFFGLPVYVVAGATLMATALTSAGGVIFYTALSPFYPQMSVAPDVSLGLIIGFGGMIGMYFGAKCQKYVPANIIKGILILTLLILALRYISQIF